MNQPIAVADSGLLSNNNIKALEQKGYEYIIGARLINEPNNVKTAELTHNIYQISYMLPKSKHTRSQLLKMEDKQTELCQIISKYF